MIDWLAVGAIGLMVLLAVAVDGMIRRESAERRQGDWPQRVPWHDGRLN